jgi:type IV fimbrial biogenesis protein FimT
MQPAAGKYMRQHAMPMSKRSGFSLIELMVVLAIAAILLGIGVPSFQVLLQNQRMTTTVNDLFAAINLTRSEAIRRGTRVDLVPADSKDWASGWVVFIDQDADQIPDAGEQIIYTHSSITGGIAIESRFADSTAKYLAYNGTGRTRTNANPRTPQLGNFLLSSEHASRRIVIGFLGRPRVCNPAMEKSTC